jgi:iron-sulfur cluster repair protein YtfE (RIC family)
MKITDAFLGEHGVFYAQFEYLEDALNVPGSLERVRALTAMLVSALESHAHMEDELLFDEMGTAGHAGALEVMREEHRDIEDTLRSAGAALDPAAAADLLRSAIRMARDHFLKEEQIAFPMADSHLGEAALHRLGEVWAQRRAVQVV